jgi:hypothetical protein
VHSSITENVKESVTAHNLSDEEDSEGPTNILDVNEDGNGSELVAEQQTETREEASESVDENERADVTLSDQDDEDAQQSTSAQATQRPSCKYAERCYR